MRPQLNCDASMWLAGRQDSPILEQEARARAASPCPPTLGAQQHSHRQWIPLPRPWVRDAALAACALLLYVLACPAPLMPCCQPDDTRRYFDTRGASLIWQFDHSQRVALMPGKRSRQNPFGLFCLVHCTLLKAASIRGAWHGRALGAKGMQASNKAFG